MGAQDVNRRAKSNDLRSGAVLNNSYETLLTGADLHAEIFCRANGPTKAKIATKLDNPSIWAYPVYASTGIKYTAEYI